MMAKPSLGFHGPTQMAFIPLLMPFLGLSAQQPVEHSPNLKAAPEKSWFL